MEVVDLLSDDHSFESAKENETSETNEPPPRRDVIVVQQGITLQRSGDHTESCDIGTYPEQIDRKKNSTSAKIIYVDCSPKQPSMDSLSSRQAVKNPYKKLPEDSPALQNPNKKKRKTAQLKGPPSKRELQAGLVFEEDVDHNTQHGRASPSLKSFDNDDQSSGDEELKLDRSLTNPPSALIYSQHQMTTRLAHNLPPILYHDLDFVAGCPSTIDGCSAKNDKSIAPPKCRCRPPRPCRIAYSSKAGPNHDRPYFCCQENRGGGCNFFSWAFTSHTLHWYRFGSHNGHVLAKSNRGFRAEDLVQGKVGDCWFLSALAVVAERNDLIGRLIGASPDSGCFEKKGVMHPNDNFGVVEVKLFVDGFWKTIIMDDFLPCLIDLQSEKEEEDSIQMALNLSLEHAGIDPEWHTAVSKTVSKRRVSSKFDPHAMADDCRRTLHEIYDFLHQDRFSKDPSYRSNPHSTFLGRCSRPLHRNVTTSDLAYSKARHNQLWVPFVEKAYAKIHGSYRAISGGQVEEAFLDLTGAPTAVYNFDHQDFNPRLFWSELMQFRSKKLPMGCGTSSSQAGIVGMHAYSILDVREVRNVGIDFFRDKLAQRTLGNVSGFTEFDGTVRLLRIRNPHGQGEWRGEFSDNSPVWERLMENKHDNCKESKGMVDLTTPQSPELKRTMINDGTFWIDFDSFLMGFSNVDVVLAFQGNHAKSFSSSFPIKTSNHRCSRAFELSAIDRQPGEDGPYSKMVEVFVMIIQKTRRGASLGRSDRKKSYKACDIGILVGERSNTKEVSGEVELGFVDGQFFGLTRNGHIRLVLDRSLPDRKLIVMPLSFGHPSATDEERSFVVRVVSDSPLLVEELPKPPKMNLAIHKFCSEGKVMSLSNAGTSQHIGTQGTASVLLECRVNKSYLYRILRIDCLAGGGGTVLLLIVVNDENLSTKSEEISFSIEINCRGMVCRSADGLENHEVITKGKKFEAAWRRFTLTFVGENRSRLLAAVVQGGQDYQVGSIKCIKSNAHPAATGPMTKYMNFMKPSDCVLSMDKYQKYEDFGVFASVDTPPKILRQCVDLSSTFPYPKKKGENPTINTTELPGIDQDAIEQDAAIMASILENKGGVDATETFNSFDQDIEKAIALSLKDR